MLHTKDYVEGYRITRSSSGLLIEVLDYHARPLRLGVAELAELGLRVLESSTPGSLPDDEAAPTVEPEP